MRVVVRKPKLKVRIRKDWKRSLSKRQLKALRSAARKVDTERGSKTSSQQIPEKFKRRVLDWDNHDPAKQLKVRELITRILALAQAMSERQFYAYQIEVGYRIVESVLLHDGDVVTALVSRQSGKTEVLSAVLGSLAIILPQLAKDFPDDWKLNITDDNGIYRGFREGIKIGIYAPRLEQANIMFERVKRWFDSDTCKHILAELKLKVVQSNGDRVTISNGSRIICQTASEQSKIEGETHHLLVLEEAQDISDMKVRKSLHPMVSSLLGSIVKIGTASTKKCDFYTAIKHNQRVEALTGKRNNFFYPYKVTQKYNSHYRKYVEGEKNRLGENSDEFRMSYGCEWIFERGMFITQTQLFHRDIAQTDGLFSIRHPNGLHKLLKYYGIVVGIDWGSASDSTVLTVMAVDWNNPIETGEYYDLKGNHEFTYYKKHVIDWVEFIGDNYEYQWGRIIEHLRSLPGLKKVVTDSNTCGRPIYDRMVVAFAGTGVEIVDFNFQPKVKSDGYKSFYGDLCRKAITFPCSPNVRKSTQWKKYVNQMLDLRKDYNNGLMVVKHPDEKGAHDDYPDSVMMASHGCNTPNFDASIEMSRGNPFY